MRNCPIHHNIGAQKKNSGRSPVESSTAAKERRLTTVDCPPPTAHCSAFPVLDMCITRRKNFLSESSIARVAHRTSSKALLVVASRACHSYRKQIHPITTSFQLHQILRIDRPNFCAYIHITANEIPAGWSFVLH